MELKENQKAWIQERRPGCLPNGIPVKVLRVDKNGTLFEYKSTKEEVLYSPEHDVITEFEDHIDVFSSDGTLRHIFNDLKVYDEYSNTAMGRFEGYAYNGFSNISKVYIRHNNNDMFNLSFDSYISANDLKRMKELNLPIAQGFIRACLEEAKRRVMDEYGSVEGVTADFILNYIPYHIFLDKVEDSFFPEPQKNNPA